LGVSAVDRLIGANSESVRTFFCFFDSDFAGNISDDFWDCLLLPRPLAGVAGVMSSAGAAGTHDKYRQPAIQ